MPFPATTDRDRTRSECDEALKQGPWVVRMAEALQGQRRREGGREGGRERERERERTKERSRFR